MNTRMIVTAAVLAVCGGSMARAEIDLTKLPPAATKPGLTFDKDIKPLFEASCVNCHGERRQRAGLRLDSLQATLQGSDEGKVVEVGNSKGSLLVHSVSQLDDETAMPPKRGGRGGGGFGGPPGGGGQGGQGGGNRERAGQGGPGGGPGGPGGGRGGGFNLAGMLASGLFTQADADKNQKLTKAEFSGLAGTWFDKIDTKKAGKLTQEEFSGGMDEVLPEINPFGGGGGGGQRGPGAGRGPGGQRGGNEGMGFGIGRMVGPAFFTAGDGDKDGSLTRAELSDTFGKWYTGWDTNKTDALTEPQFRDGFAASMPRGGGGRGPGGGAFAGFGFGRTALAAQMITQGDADKNEKLSKAEFMAMADVWFDKVDAAKAGKVNQEQFSAKLAAALGMPDEPAPAAPQAGARNGEGGNGRGGGARPDAGGPGGPGGGPRGGGVSSMGPGLFSAVDGDKDGSLTRTELKATFEKWFASFDSAKSGALDNDSLYAGLREVIPQGGFGGMGGGGGFPGGRGGDAPAKPLTAEQVGLVRAWIDQGAK